MSSDHGTWTIDKSASGVSDLSVGKVLLIAGVDCARVTSLEDNGDGTMSVKVAPVAIVDVIKEGSLEWSSKDIDLSQGFMGQVPYAIVIGSEVSDAGAPDAGGSVEDAGEPVDGGTDASALDGGAVASDASIDDAGEDGGGCEEDGGGCHIRLGGIHPLGNPTNNPTNSVSLTIANWAIQFTGTTGSDGSLDFSGTAAWQPASPTFTLPGDPSSTLGAINTSVGVGIHLNNIQGATGSLSVSGGTLSNANISSSMAGSADLSASISTPSGSQFPKQAVLKLPIAAEFPIYWGPIPMYLSFQAAILIQPSLATKGASLAIANHIDYSGSAGMTFSNGTADPSSMPSGTGPANGLDSITATPQIGAMALVFAVQAPRVGFGVGTMAFGVGVKAGVYVDMVNSFGVTIAPVTSLVPCEEAEWQLTSHGGGEVNIGVGATTLTATHSIDLYALPADGPQSWYTPMVSACRP